MTSNCRKKISEKCVSSVIADRCKHTDWLLQNEEVSELSQWMDRELAALEEQFREFRTHDSVKSSLSR